MQMTLTNIQPLRWVNKCAFSKHVSFVCQLLSAASKQVAAKPLYSKNKIDLFSLEIVTKRA